MNRFGTPEGYVGPQQPLRVGDIIRVDRQPDNQFADIVGERGVIEEIKDGYANIQCFELDGRTSGSGSVPLKCMARELDPKWHDAKKKADEHFAAYERKVIAYNERYQAQLKAVAKKHKVSVAKVRAIYSEMDIWVDNQNP